MGAGYGIDTVRITDQTNPRAVDNATMQLDNATNALTTITYEHHEVHSGSHFVCRSFQEIPLGDFYDIQIVTPNTTKWPHVTFAFDSEKETNWWVYENVVINVAGGALACGNRDRNSTKTATTTLAGIANTDLATANADTAVAAATLLASGVLGSGQKSTGPTTSREEIILKQNTAYTLRFNCVAAGYVNYQLDWYEHVNKR